MTSTPTVRATTLDVPGARLHYEVRGSGPLVALVAAPMTAAAFAPLADLLATDYTVLTTDPRGHHGSVLDDPDQDSTPELRADDLARLITHLDAGPAVVLGSSGGAITTLAVAQAHPELVSMAIAHEPPLLELLDDRDTLRAGTLEMIRRYRTGDVLGAWGKFFAQANIAMPEPVLEQLFGGDRDPAVVASERFWFEHELRGGTGWVPNFARLRTVSTRIVAGLGADSAGQLCERTTLAVAAELGLETTMFPGGHTGFADDPVTFESALRAVLSLR